MENLFDIPIDKYRLERKVQKLRQKIKERTAELNILPEHTEDGHFYRYGDKKYASVTGRLQILKDPGLANWKMNRACDYIYQQLINSVGSWNTPQVTSAMIERAKLVPQQEFQGAGDLGTRVHNWREQWFTTEIADPILNDHPIPHDEDPRFISATRAIKRFKVECDYRPVACELYVADHELETGGQVDDIGFVNGELALVDLKTSNIGDKESYYAQVALYYHMFTRLYKVRPRKLYILHVSKQDGTYRLIEIPDINKTIKWAKKVIEVAKGLDEIKESKKKQYINI